MFYIIIAVASFIVYQALSAQESRIRELEDEKYDKEHENDYIDYDG